MATRSSPSLVPAEGIGRQARLDGETEKAAVHRPLEQPALHIGIVAAEQAEAAVRADGLEPAEDFRQPLGGDAAEGPHPNDPALFPGQGLALITEKQLVLPHPADIGEQRLPLWREMDAAFVPGEEPDAPFLFQLGDGIAHVGGGVAQGISRGGEAPQLHRCEKDLVSGQAHFGTLLSRMHPSRSLKDGQKTFAVHFSGDLLFYKRIRNSNLHLKKQERMIRMSILFQGTVAYRAGTQQERLRAERILRRQGIPYCVKNISSMPHFQGRRTDRESLPCGEYAFFVHPDNTTRVCSLLKK